ncbi:MAG: transposase [Deltaproteobacteria bacterium]
MKKVAYLAMDVHSGHCVLGHMDFDGTFIGNRRFPTSEQHIIEALKAIKAKEKYLALEESNLAYWAAQVARAYVTEVISSDPKENALIYRSPNKRDKVDTHKLCRLLRLGELKRVYHPENDERAIFKAAVQHYIDLRGQQVVLKNKIKAMYRHWGVIEVGGQFVYGIRTRDDYLQRVKHLQIRNQLHRLYCLMDETESMQKKALKAMKQLGRKYPEIKQFEKMPGIGEILSHTFDAFVQTPHRFADKRKLWRYCRLGITDRSSDGKPLGFKRLDKSGVSELKAVSYRAWLSAMRSDNEVRRFYSRSLRLTVNHVHARLNTQRKIIAVMYGMWKRGEAYRPQLFLDSPQMSVVQVRQHH